MLRCYPRVKSFHGARLFLRSIVLFRIRTKILPLHSKSPRYFVSGVGKFRVRASMDWYLVFVSLLILWYLYYRFVVCQPVTLVYTMNELNQRIVESIDNFSKKFYP